ncbi:MAG: ion transporter [Rhodothermia bacterium]|nr:ion transporter [Rhodothermia bacterium]
MLKNVPPKHYASMPGLRGRLNEVIFGVDTPYGRRFDLAVIIVISLSVVAVMLESVESIRARFAYELFVAEWVFTVIFTIEYTLRVFCAQKRLRYVGSFYGLVDLLGTIPTYISLLVPGAQFLLVIRLLRILRVFRVLRLAQFLSEADVLIRALRSSRHKIAIFISAVLILVVILGSLMYLVEGAENGFTSIPRGIYWAIVTLTTVGYGDISPQTGLGQALAAVVMIMGYGIIAVPTGIVTAELTRTGGRHPEIMACSGCGSGGHDLDAIFCKRCGERL